MPLLAPSYSGNDKSYMHKQSLFAMEKRAEKKNHDRFAIGYSSLLAPLDPFNL